MNFLSFAKRLIAKIKVRVTTKRLLVVLTENGSAQILGWQMFSVVPQIGDDMWCNVDGTSVILRVCSRCFCESDLSVMVPSLLVERKCENGDGIAHKSTIM